MCIDSYRIHINTGERQTPELCTNSTEVDFENFIYVNMFFVVADSTVSKSHKHVSMSVSWGPLSAQRILCGEVLCVKELFTAQG